MRRMATAMAFAVVAGALLLQVTLTVTARLDKGDSLIGALAFYFSFFTILSNLMVALVYLSDLTTSRWLGWWRVAWVRAMMVGAIMVVMGIYHFVLSGLAHLAGLDLVADRLLHYADPLLYLAWWLMFQRHRAVGWHDLPRMLVYPLCYLVWAMGRGTLVGEYPYPFIDASKLGYAEIMLNCLGILGGFVILYAITIGIDGRLGRRTMKTP